MNKKELSERDICTKFITPALRQAGWDEQTQLREEVSFTKGRVIVRGKMVSRGAAKRADYILYYKANIPLAVIEAKDNNCAVADGMQQAIEYAKTLDLRSTFMVECVEAKMRGQAYPAINDSDFATLPFPLPPLPEQERIVAKVAELMTLCDRLEAAQAERETRRNLVVVSALHRLRSAEGSNAGQQASDIVVGTTLLRGKQIQQLREAVATLAVQGRLVPQKTEDRPKPRTVRRGSGPPAQEINRIDESLADATHQRNLQPFVLPASWKWVTTQQVSVSVYRAAGNAVLPRTARDAVSPFRFSFF